MKKISCVYSTARPSRAMVGREEDHIRLYLDCLSRQTLQMDDLEVIIADCYNSRRPLEHRARDNRYGGKLYPFDITHFQVRSPWLDLGLWSRNASRNQGAMLSQGELLVMFEDCCEVPPEYLERVWEWYERGRWALGLVVFKGDGKHLNIDDEDLDDPANNVSTLRMGIEEGLADLKRHGVMEGLVRDSRWPLVERAGGVLKLNGADGAKQMHCYSAIPLDALLRINGFDENLDGDAALGDIDCGTRIHLAGYDDVFVLDRDVWLFENAHHPVPDELLTYRGPSIRSNYSLLKLNESRGRWRANSYALTEEEVDWICEHARDWGFRNIDMKANPYFRAWLKHPPIFGLSELRREVQDKLTEGFVEIPDYYLMSDVYGGSGLGPLG